MRHHQQALFRLYRNCRAN